MLATLPPPMAVRPFTPTWLNRLLRRRLAKDPGAARSIPVELSARYEHQPRVDVTGTTSYSGPPTALLYAIRSDGSGEAKRLTEGAPVARPNSFSPDAKRPAISLQGTGNGGSFDKGLPGPRKDLG